MEKITGLKVYPLPGAVIPLISLCIADFEADLTKLSLKERRPCVYGSPQRRDVVFYSDFSAGYRYSGQVAVAHKLTKNMINIIKYFDVNGILVNRYIGGKDIIGPHSDDITRLATTDIITVSVGAIRKFRIRDKKTKEIIADILTEPYMVIHMFDDFQAKYTHEIVQDSSTGIRYSLTFRNHSV